MNIFYLWLLLVVVLSAYSEGPHIKPLDSLGPSVLAVDLNSTIAQLGVLVPVLPQNGALHNLPQNGVLHNLPQNEVLQNLPQNEVSKSAYKIDSIFKRVQNMISEMNSLLKLSVESFKKLTSTLMNSVRKFGWGIRITFSIF
jgi:hypothetical protein